MFVICNEKNTILLYNVSLIYKQKNFKLKYSRNKVFPTADGKSPLAFKSDTLVKLTSCGRAITEVFICTIATSSQLIPSNHSILKIVFFSMALL